MNRYQHSMLWVIKVFVMYSLKLMEMLLQDNNNVRARIESRIETIGSRA